MASATSSCAGASQRSATSASSRPAPASATRSISNTWRRRSGPRRTAAEPVGQQRTDLGQRQRRLGDLAGGRPLGDDVLEAGSGDLVLKPRGEWHTFWNAGDAPCRILEIIAPAGFEGFFAELVDLGGVAQADPATLGELCQRYALEMDPSSIPSLIERFGVRFPAEPVTR